LLQKLKIATLVTIRPAKQLLITAKQPVLAILGVIKRVANQVLVPQAISMKPMFLALLALASLVVHILITV
ncbi:hypothetical protein CO134_03635, partial [Candidatus Kuenenbacteria bacterium CG_4_9_14_3_um_filter_39_14]